MDFLLDPEVAYLNHGSYGACPAPVFEAYQRFQRELERNPSEFLGRRFHELIGRGADGAGGVRRRPGGRSRLRAERDRGAERGHPLAAARARRRGADDAARVRRRHPDVGVRRRERSSTPSRTSSSTRSGRGRKPSRSATSPRRPRSCSRSRRSAPPRARPACSRSSTARTRPGSCRSTSSALGADVYAGNCHKWLCAPKGAGFLWARPGAPALDRAARRLVGLRRRRSFADRHGWQGTRDPAAALDDAGGDRGARDVRPRALPGAGGIVPRPPAALRHAAGAADVDDRAACRRSRGAAAAALRRAPDRGDRARVGGTKPAARSRSRRTTRRPTSSACSTRSNRSCRLASAKRP